MVITCSASGCSSSYLSGSTLSFFGFPLKNPAIVSKWVTALNRDGFSPSRYSKLCSNHFLPQDLLHRPGSYRPRLKETAVPSIFPLVSHSNKKRRICLSSVQANPTQPAGALNCKQIESNEALFEATNFSYDCANLQDINMEVPVSHTQDQTDDLNVPEVMRALRQKVKLLQRKLNRRDQTNIRLKNQLAFFKKYAIIHSQSVVLD